MRVDRDGSMATRFACHLQLGSMGAVMVASVRVLARARMVVSNGGLIRTMQDALSTAFIPK